MKHYQKQKMNEIVTCYFIYKNQFNILSFSSGDYDYSNPYYLYYRNVEIAFSKLSDEEKTIIINDFFENTSNEWWKSIFSKNEYISRKNKAVKNFLRFFDEIG